MMENLRISLSLVDGSCLDYDLENGKELITKIFGDDTGRPPRGLTIEATTDDGQTVKINLGYTDSPRAHVRIEHGE